MLPKAMAALLFTAVAGAGGCGHTLRPGQVGLKYQALRHPALQESPLEDGYYVQWPWNHLVVYDATSQSRDVDVDVLTSDDLHVPTTSTVVFRIDPTRIYELHTRFGPEYYDEIVRPELVSLIRDHFADYRHNDLARSSDAIEDAVTRHLREALTEVPIEIDSVAIKHIRFDTGVTTAISKKLMMEQQAEQKAFEIRVAEQDAEIARTAAKGEADAIRIRAEGDAAAIVVVGEAQSEAQEAITQTLTSEYLQYKAFDGTSTRYYFVPVGKDGLPLIIEP